MAGEKTEQPTDKKLRDARQQGQVAKSQEIPATAVVIGMFGFVWLGYDWFVDGIKDLMILATSCIGRPFSEGIAVMVRAGLRAFFLLSIPPVVLAAVAGVVGHLGQVGVLFAIKAITPKLDKLNPKQWFSKVFSLKNLVEFLRSILKIGVVIVVFYLVFKDALPVLMRLPGQGLHGVDMALRQVMKGTVMYSVAAFAAIAVVDWLFQRWQFTKEQRMTKDEVKNEYKEMEGDPHIKGQRKQLHQEMAMSEQIEGARKADVLITNPTHLAIAIQYREDETPLPIILAKGQGALAEQMMKAAEEAGVPIMRNVPLAWGLWEQGEALEYIPSSLIEPVAEVLSWLRELREGGGQ